MSCTDFNLRTGYQDSGSGNDNQGVRLYGVVVLVTLNDWLLNTLRPGQNGCHFADIFNCIFLNEKFKYDLTEICSLGSNSQYGSIGSDNGLALNRRQAIIWSYVGML